MMPRKIDELVKAAALPLESPTDKYRELLRLADANGDDARTVHEFFCQFERPQRVRYVQWFRADELLSHVRTWKDRSHSQEEFWIRVMQSRTHADQLKIWLLGADRINLSACFDMLLGQKAINIQEQYGTVASEEKFSLLSTHVDTSVVLDQFGTGKCDLRHAMENLSTYLQEGLSDFFSSNGCTGDACITAFAPNELGTRQWLNRQFFVTRRNAGSDNGGGANWAHVFDIVESTEMPPRKRLKETWLLCLLFCFPRVISARSSCSPMPQSMGRMPNSHATDGKHRFEGDEFSLEASFFKALGDPTRLNLFRIILKSKEPLSVSELQKRSGGKITTISECLQELKAARLVDCHRAGRFRLYFACIEQFRAQLQSVLSQLRVSRTPVMHPHP
jgi:DNA-binding transcriptional ArsR family regulator